jgi:hypothetical protein
MDPDPDPRGSKHVDPVVTDPQRCQLIKISEICNYINVFR